MTKNSSWTHQLFWGEMEPRKKKKTPPIFGSQFWGECEDAKNQGKCIYISVIFLCRSWNDVFWCNSKCTHAKIKFGCSNIIRAHVCIIYNKQYRFLCLYSYTSIFSLVRKTHHQRQFSAPQLSIAHLCPWFSVSRIEKGSETMMRSEWKDPTVNLRWSWCVFCHPTLDQGCTSRWWFKMSSFFWQVRDGGWN